MKITIDMKKIVIIPICCLFSFFVFSQDTIYMNKQRKQVSKDNARYYEIEPSKNDEKPYYDIIYLLDGTPKFETIYNSSKKKRVIKRSAWYDNGTLQLEFNYKNGKRDGKSVTYWKKGTLKREDIYSKGKFIRGKCWDEQGTIIPYYDFEIHPEFPGGKSAFNQYLEATIDSNNISNTTVHVKFFINPNGKVSGVELIKKSNSLELNESVLNAIKNMPKWKPAKQDGNEIGVWRTLPLRF